MINFDELEIGDVVMNQTGKYKIVSIAEAHFDNPAYPCCHHSRYVNVTRPGVIRMSLTDHDLKEYVKQDENTLTAENHAKLYVQMMLDTGYSEPTESERWALFMGFLCQLRNVGYLPKLFRCGVNGEMIPYE